MSSCFTCCFRKTCKYAEKPAKNSIVKINIDKTEKKTVDAATQTDTVIVKKDRQKKLRIETDEKISTSNLPNLIDTPTPTRFDGMTLDDQLKKYRFNYSPR